MNTLRILIAITVLALCAAASAQDVNFRGWEDYPGLYFYLVQPPALWEKGVRSVEWHVTKDRVAGLHALKIDFKEAEGLAGTFAYAPPGFAILDRTGYAGLSFWVKGDGSDGMGVLGIGDGRSTDPKVYFRLKDKTWQPVRVRWADFDRVVAGRQVQSVFLTVTPDTKRPCSYVVDDMELVKDVRSAEADAKLREEGDRTAKLPEPPWPADLSAFASSCDKLAGFRALVAGKKPAKILLIGDGVANGVRLWSVPAGALPKVLFGGRLRDKLLKLDPDVTVSTLVVEGPEDASSRIATLLARESPALVLLEFSSADPKGGDVGAKTRAREAMQTLFAECRRANVPVFAAAIAPLPSRVIRVDFADMLIEEGAKAGVPVADFGKLAAARGKTWQGEYYATPDQLNIQGHDLLADLLATCLSPAANKP